MTSESRLDRLEAIVEGLRSEMQSLRTDINARFAEVNSRFSGLESQVNSRFNTLIMLNVALWVTTIGTIIGLTLGTR